MIYTCATCNVEFTAPPSQKRKYCSLKCRPATKKKKPDNSVCVVCGGEFYRYPSYIKEGRNKCCSKKCANVFISELWKVHPERQAITARLADNVDNEKRIANRNATWSRMRDEGLIKGRKGPDSNFWKGGIATSRQAIRSSKEYVNWRTAVFIRDNRTCVLCGYKGPDIEADHYPYPFTAFPEHRYDVDNGRTLCKPCHKYVTFTLKEWENASSGIS